MAVIDDMHIGKEVHIPPSDAVWLLAGCVLVSITPWLWIGYNDSTMASAWGTVTFKLRPRGISDGATPPAAGSRRHLDGDDSNREASTVWVPIIITYFVAVSMLYLIKEPDRVPELETSYVLSFVLAFTILKFAYSRLGHAPGKTGQDVRPALMVNFFIFGGLLGVCFTVVFQTTEQLLCSKSFPSCSMIYLDRVPLIREPSKLTPMTASCSVLSAMMWVVVDGIVEETGKAIWLFWRLRRHECDLPNTCFFHVFSVLPGTECSNWFKLVSSPRHVLLCALSCGAGYQCLENVKYGLHRTPLPSGFAARQHFSGVHPPLSSIAVFCILTSVLHIVWTGLIGAGLAKHMFGHPNQRPSLVMTVLPSILLHGIFDWGLAGLHNLTMRMDLDDRMHLDLVGASTGMELRCLFTFVIVASFSASCYLLYHRVRNLPSEEEALLDSDLCE